ncbi:MAG: tRNA uridine-5-carboxymethylaminomethyl(34) synthesis GTPase MnmE, partial [Saprospiraceae bacterium]
IPTSAKNQMNIIYLKERILQTIHSDHALLAQNIVSNARHVDSLVKVQEHLARARTQVTNQSGHELIAMDIRQALHYLGEITGEVTTDELLESIFGRFCIGK